MHVPPLPAGNERDSSYGTTSRADSSTFDWFDIEMTGSPSHVTEDGGTADKSCKGKVNTTSTNFHDKQKNSNLKTHAKQRNKQKQSGKGILQKSDKSEMGQEEVRAHKENP